MPDIVRIKVGVVGCGAIAQIMHLPHLKELNDLFDLKAICDLSNNLLNAIGQKYNIDVNCRYTDYAAMLQSDIDAIFCLTEGSHAPFVKQALLAGKHAFCEKPLCFTLQEAEEIEAILDKSDKILMVGYMKRYDHGFKHALELVKKIEKPRYSQVTVLHPSEQQYFDIHNILRFNDAPHDMREAGIKARNELLTTAVGNIPENLKFIYFDAMLSSLVHNVNLIRTVFGEPRGVLSTQIWPADSYYPTINTVLNYGDAHHLIITWSYLSDVRNYTEEFAVYSDSERIKVKFSSPFLKNTPTKVSHEFMQDGQLINSEIEASFDNAFKEELRVFYECITTNKKVPTDASDAKADIALLQAILAANQPTGLGGEALTRVNNVKTSQLMLEEFV